MMLNMQLLSLCFKFVSRLGQLCARFFIGTRKLGKLVAQFFQFFAASHHRGQFLAADLRLSEGTIASSTVKQGETITDGIGMMGVVGNKDYSQTACSRLRDIAQDDASLF